MAKITREYARRAYLSDFLKQSPEMRLASIEALTILHESVLVSQEPERKQPAPMFDPEVYGAPETEPPFDLEPAA
jgi:hypothetical protein